MLKCVNRFFSVATWIVCGCGALIESLSVFICMHQLKTLFVGLGVCIGLARG